jgi:hypothetical protein
MSEESSVDRMIREAREKGHAHHAKSEDHKEFHGKALERIIPKIMDPMCEGLRRAPGEPQRGPVLGHSALRHFIVSARSRTEHLPGNPRGPDGARSGVFGSRQSALRSFEHQKGLSRGFPRLYPIAHRSGSAPGLD